MTEDVWDVQTGFWEFYCISSAAIRCQQGKKALLSTDVAEVYWKDKRRVGSVFLLTLERWLETKWNSWMHKKNAQLNISWLSFCLCGVSIGANMCRSSAYRAEASWTVGGRKVLICIRTMMEHLWRSNQNCSRSAIREISSIADRQHLTFDCGTFSLVWNSKALLAAALTSATSSHIITHTLFIRMIH